ncbi:hypothetical protein HDU97_002751 [Phlyctochytrium planicorne]|nr:hypothetical protein HDU97_002751 [Phlyctochytrium planicorne]
MTGGYRRRWQKQQYPAEAADLATKTASVPTFGQPKSSGDKTNGRKETKEQQQRVNTPCTSSPATAPAAETQKPREYVPPHLRRKPNIKKPEPMASNKAFNLDESSPQPNVDAQFTSTPSAAAADGEETSIHNEFDVLKYLGIQKNPDVLALRLALVELQSVRFDAEQMATVASTQERRTRDARHAGRIPCEMADDWEKEVKGMYKATKMVENLATEYQNLISGLTFTIQRAWRRELVDRRFANVIKKDMFDKACKSLSEKKILHRLIMALPEPVAPATCWDVPEESGMNCSRRLIENSSEPADPAESELVETLPAWRIEEIPEDLSFDFVPETMNSVNASDEAGPCSDQQINSTSDPVPDLESWKEASEIAVTADGVSAIHQVDIEDIVISNVDNQTTSTPAYEIADLVEMTAVEERATSKLVQQTCTPGIDVLITTEAHDQEPQLPSSATSTVEILDDSVDDDSACAVLQVLEETEEDTQAPCSICEDERPVESEIATSGANDITHGPDHAKKPTCKLDEIPRRRRSFFSWTNFAGPVEAVLRLSADLASVIVPETVQEAIPKLVEAAIGIVEPAVSSVMPEARRVIDGMKRQDSACLVEPFESSSPAVSWIEEPPTAPESITGTKSSATPTVCVNTTPIQPSSTSNDTIITDTTTTKSTLFLAMKNATAFILNTFVSMCKSVGNISYALVCKAVRCTAIIAKAFLVVRACARSPGGFRASLPFSLVFNPYHRRMFFKRRL